VFAGHNATAFEAASAGLARTQLPSAILDCNSFQSLMVTALKNQRCSRRQIRKKLLTLKIDRDI
jgi:hypothetical protein